MKLKYIPNLLKYIKSNICSLIVMFVLTAINQICYLILPSLMAKIIDDGIIKNTATNSNYSQQLFFILKIGYQMLLVTIFSVIITIIINKLMSKISCDISMKLRKDVFHKIINLSYFQICDFSPSSLITRVTSDVENVKSFIIMLTQLIVPPFMMLGGIILSLQISKSITMIILISALISALISYLCIKIITSRAKYLQEMEDQFNLTIKQQLQGIEVIRGYGNSKFEEEKFDNSNYKFANISFFINKITSIMSPAISICANLTSVLVLWISSVKVKETQMEVGQVVAITQYAIMIIGAFIIISMMISSIPKSIISIKRIYDILSIKEPIKKFKNLKPNFDKKIEFKNVYFKYPKSSDYTLKNINFSANYGETIGIIGSVGCGKSTILKLIIGFYKQTSGDIFFGIENSKDINEESLQQNISYVSQNDYIFSSSIKDNLKIPNKNITESEMIEILKLVNLENFATPEGLNTKILQSGKNISGGQKQRLTIARSLLKNSSIYIFDDIFSNLDYKTEQDIKNKILQKIKGKTIFLISQRIATLKNLDKIIVLDEGKIINIGNHDMLLKNCKLYRKISDLQTGARF